MGRGKMQRKKGKGKRKRGSLPGASVRGALIAKGFSAAAARQTMKVQNKHCRLVYKRTDLRSQDWADTIRPQQDCLLINMPPEVRLRIWEFCILNLPCGSKPITVALSMRQYDRESRFVASSREASYRGEVAMRQKFFDSEHLGFQAQMFNLSTICRQAYLDIVGGSLLYKLKGFRFTDGLSLVVFLNKLERTGAAWYLIPKLFFEWEARCYEDLIFVCKSLEIAHSFIKLEKLRLKINVCVPDLLVNADDSRYIHPQVVIDTITDEKAPAFWQWLESGLTTHNLRDFSMEITCLPSYVHFGGNKRFWHIIRNESAIRDVDMESLSTKLAGLYPNGRKDPYKGIGDSYTAPKGTLWVEYALPLSNLEQSLETRRNQKRARLMAAQEEASIVQ